MKTLNLKRSILTFLLFTAIGFLIYSNSIHGEFIYDDILNIESNPIVQNARNLKPIFGYNASRFFPYFSFALNYFFHQTDTFGYHLVNILIHIFNTGLVFWLTRILLGTKKFIRFDGNSHYLLSALTALIFLAHPIQTQAVSSIVQRITLLSTSFYLSSIVLYLKSRFENRKISWVLSIILCAMAMASRENSATLPFMLCFLELHIIRETDPASKAKTFQRLAPFFLCVIIIPMLLIYSMQWGRMLAGIGRETAFITRSTYFFTQASVINTYVSLFFLPIFQNADYDYPLTHSAMEPSFLLGAAVLLLISILVVRWGRRHPILILGWVWFLVALSVESSVIPIMDVIQEHRLYLPMIGLSWIASYAIIKIIQPPKIRAAVISVLVLILCVLTINRNRIWQTDVAFWKDVVVKSPLKSRGQMGLGAAHLKKMNFSEAESCLLKAIELDPENIGAQSNLGVFYSHTGDHHKALAYMKTAHELNPQNPLYLHNLGHEYIELSQYDDAFYYYKKLISEFFSSYTADQYFRLLVNYYEATKDMASTLGYAQALEPHFTEDEYEEILGLLRRLENPSP